MIGLFLLSFISFFLNGENALGVTLVKELEFERRLSFFKFKNYFIFSAGYLLEEVFLDLEPYLSQIMTPAWWVFAVFLFYLAMLVSARRHFLVMSKTEQTRCGCGIIFVGA